MLKHEGSRGRTVILDQLPPHLRAPGRIELVEVHLRDLPSVRLLPGADLNGSQCFGVIHGGQPDYHSRHHVTLPPT